jgi:hypothetical protein
VGVARNLKKTAIAFAIEATCIALAYLAYVFWDQGSITGSALADILLTGFFVMLFVLNYALVSKHPPEEDEDVGEPLALTSGTKKDQALKYLKVLGSATSGQLASLLEIDVRNLSKFINPLIQTGIVTARKEGKTFLYSLKSAHTILHMHNRHNPLEEGEYAGHIELPKWRVKLPKEGSMLGRVPLDDWKLGEFFYLPLRKHAQKGILVSGASGAGKTVAAKVIVEELLEEKIPVLVFDYTKQWQRLLEKNTDEGMLDRYAEFGMRRSPKGFKGQIVHSAPQLDQLATNSGVTIVDLSDTYDSGERVDKVARMLDQLLEYFQFQEDSENLRLLIVVEEAHLWTSKDLPKDAMRFLDSAVRLLRKKGVGVMLVSQKISDFDPAMRSAMNISILFRTKYEGDLRAIGRMLGSEISALIPRLPVGYSVFHLADVGDPFVAAWRPTYSQP